MKRLLKLLTRLYPSAWRNRYGEEYDRAADKYFRSSKRPTMDETIAYYREKKIGFVNFTVDAETQMGRRRIPNEEIAEAAQKNSDIMIAFGSIDPHKGKFGARAVIIRIAQIKVRRQRQVRFPRIRPQPKGRIDGRLCQGQARRCGIRTRMNQVVRKS